MPTNLYFHNFPKKITDEQLLVEDLVIEAMQIYGMDVFYLPRTSASENNIDYLYGEDTLKRYTRAYPIEMYLENVTGMQGEGDFISKFGLEIRDETTLLVSRRRFKSIVPNLNRPNEGDLIYVPLVQNFFEITMVEHENDQAMFYTLGRGRGGNVYVYALSLKQFVFSEELIETGITEIDLQAFESYKKTKILLNSGTGSYLPSEYVYQGNNLNTATAIATVHSFVQNTQLNIMRIKGTFVPNEDIIGNKSGASYIVQSIDYSTQVDSNVEEDLIDNINIEQESDQIIDFSEENPFGNI
jgi:hypothetical protein